VPRRRKNELPRSPAPFAERLSITWIIGLALRTEKVHFHVFAWLPETLAQSGISTFVLVDVNVHFWYVELGEFSEARIFRDYLKSLPRRSAAKGVCLA
jgi:hypothetical protein